MRANGGNHAAGDRPIDGGGRSVGWPPKSGQLSDQPGQQPVERADRGSMGALNRVCRSLGAYQQVDRSFLQMQSPIRQPSGDPANGRRFGSPGGS